MIKLFAGTTAMTSPNQSRQRSPDGIGSERKRRRKVLSCYDCRRRKLQCDRGMPACGRCTKAGQGSQCLYIDDAVDMLAKPPAPEPLPAPSHSQEADGILASSGDLLVRLEYQDRRIKQLEAALARSGHTAPVDAMHKLKSAGYPAPQPITGTGGLASGYGAIITDRDSAILRGKSFKTRFNGTTCQDGLICHIPELNTFTREAFEKFPVLARMRHGIHSLKERPRYTGSQPSVTTGDQLRSLLPSREQADPGVQLYFETYGTLYHVLHLPTFRRDYEALWVNPKVADAHFVALLLLLLAAVQCLASDHPRLYAAKSSSAREKAVTWIAACEGWLATQSQKHVKAADFQIRFLLLLTKQVTAHKFKRTWTEAGTFVRFCMSAGLHRDPELVRKPTSALDKELRRRIWAAAVEIELEISVDRGMVPGNWPLQADCSAPGNLLDDDLDQESEQLPVRKPYREFTHSSFLVIAQQSISLRHSLATTLNNIRQQLSFEDVKIFTEKINTHLESIPTWKDPRSGVAYARLTLILRQCLLILHDRHFRQAETTAERNFSRMLLIDAALDIVDTHKALVKKGVYALEVLCSEQLRAALSVIQLITTLISKSGGVIDQAIEDNASRILDDVCGMLTDKVNRFGREQRQLWIAVAAHGYLKSRRDPDRRMTYMQEAVDKITVPYYKITACQEDMQTLDPSVPSANLSRQEDDGLPLQHDFNANPAESATKTGGLNTADTPLLDFDEVAAWTFDDWSFDPTELQQTAYGDTYQI